MLSQNFLQKVNKFSIARLNNKMTGPVFRTCFFVVFLTHGKSINFTTELLYRC